MVWFWKTTNRKIAPAPSLLDADLMHEEQDERFRDTTNLSRAAERDAQLAGISPALFYKIDDTIRSLSPEEAYSASDILNNFLYRWIAESNGDGVHALICSRVIDLLQSRLREIQERSEDLRNQPLGVGTHIWTYVVTFFSNKKERPIHGQIHDDRLQMRFLKDSEEARREFLHEFQLKLHLASWLVEHGRGEEAETVYMRLQEISTWYFGDQHPTTTSILGNLGFLKAQQKKYDEAEELYAYVLRTKLSILGDLHPSTLATVQNYAALLKDSGQYNAAKELYRRVVGAYDRRVAPYNGEASTAAVAPAAAQDALVISFENLACINLELGEKRGETIALLERVLEFKRTKLPEAHPELMSICETLGILYAGEQWYAKAVRHLQEAVRGREWRGDRLLLWDLGQDIEMGSPKREGGELRLAEGVDSPPSPHSPSFAPSSSSSSASVSASVSQVSSTRLEAVLLVLVQALQRSDRPEAQQEALVHLERLYEAFADSLPLLSPTMQLPAAAPENINQQGWQWGQVGAPTLLTPTHPFHTAIEVLDNLTEVYMSIGIYDKAETALRDLLDLKKTAIEGVEDEADEDEEEGEGEEGEYIGSKEKETRDKKIQWQKDRVSQLEDDICGCIFSLAESCVAQGKLDEGEQLHRQCCEARSSLESQYGDDETDPPSPPDPDRQRHRSLSLYFSMQALGSCLVRANKTEEAKPLYEGALQGFDALNAADRQVDRQGGVGRGVGDGVEDAVMGRYSLIVADSLSALCIVEGDLHQAEDLIQRLMGHYTLSLGPSHEVTRRLQGRLGELDQSLSHTRRAVMSATGRQSMVLW